MQRLRTKILTSVYLRERARSRQNPAKGLFPPLFPKEVYDPREEAIRAVARGTGGMWGVAVGKYGQSRSPAEIIQRSWERYQDVDHLIRGRQEYEIMLGRGRQSGPFRIVPEPTRTGVRYFVWPLAVGEPPPRPFLNKAEAEAEVARRYRLRITIATALPSEPYTREMLAAWLPPDSVFEGRSGETTKAAQKPRPAKAALPGEQGAPTPARTMQQLSELTLIQQYQTFDRNWYKDPELNARFRDQKPPPSR